MQGQQGARHCHCCNGVSDSTDGTGCGWICQYLSGSRATSSSNDCFDVNCLDGDMAMMSEFCFQSALQGVGSNSLLSSKTKVPK